jgi:hypothetical protein
VGWDLLVSLRIINTVSFVIFQHVRAVGKLAAIQYHYVAMRVSLIVSLAAHQLHQHLFVLLDH